MYFKMPFDPVDRTHQVKGIVSFPQSDKYSVQLQRLLKRMFEMNPKKRPSMSDTFKYVESLQSKAQGIPTKPRRRFSGFDEEDNRRDSSEEEAKKYKTAHDQEDLDDDDKMNQADGSSKDFSGFGTKLKVAASKNGTKGWVLYAPENSNFPPRIQYISK
jgi:serine/threonine protein kinase